MINFNSALALDLSGYATQSYVQSYVSSYGGLRAGVGSDIVNNKTHSLVLNTKAKVAFCGYMNDTGYTRLAIVLCTVGKVMAVASSSYIYDGTFNNGTFVFSNNEISAYSIVYYLY